MPVIAKLAAVMALSVVASTAVAEPVPAALKPTRVAGSGFNVINLDAERDWYIAHLGMQVVGVIGPKDKPIEYLMGTGSEPDQAILALLKTKRPDGPNGFSRLILDAPEPKALAARLAAEGVPTREVIPNTAYFVTDPEGNAIELYRAPAK